MAPAHSKLYPEFEDAFATMNRDWNGPYWLEHAVEQDQADHHDPPVDASHDVPPAGANIICATIASIPPGRQASKILQCGICFSDKLWDRKADLERHMLTHQPGAYPCTVAACSYVGDKAFKRAEHLRNHLRKIHGQNQI